MKTKTKFVPVKFDTPEELGKAMLDGRVFSIGDDDYHTVLKAIDCSFIKITCSCYLSTVNLDTVYDSQELREIIKDVRWENALLHENKGGILCWVWDDVQRIVIGIVSAFDPEDIYPYTTKERGWRHAVPLTKEEVEKYSYRGDC